MELEPLEILNGDAESETVGGGVGGGETLIFTVAVALPPGPETVIKYVVATGGLTVVLPLTVAAKFDEETLVASVELQVNVTLFP